MSEAATIRHSFPTTRWSVIINAQSDTTLRKEALQQLLRAYWTPLYTYARRRGCPREAAQDIVQSFCLRLLEKDFINKLNPTMGSLRAYLRTALRNFIANEQERDQAQKRGGAFEFTALEADAAEGMLSYLPPTPDAAFDHEWALSVLERCLEKLTAEYHSGKRTGPVEVLLELFRFGDIPPYRTIAEQHSMSVVQVKSFVHRARRRFREILREEIGETLEEGDDLESETEELLRCLT